MYDFLLQFEDIISLLDPLLELLLGMNAREVLLDPLKYQFMERAMQASVLVGLVSGIIGCFVVVRGMAFLGDALAHSILPGVAIAYIREADLFIGGLIAGIATALGIGWLTREERIKEDTAIGVVFAGMYALGIAIISTQRSYSADLAHILFGNVLGVKEEDLHIMRWCGVIVVATILLFYKELVVLSFDASHARVIKLPTEFLRLLLLVLIAVTIVASLQTVGVALMLALLVTPAATARLLVKRLHFMILIAAFLGTVSGIIGLYVSYHKNVASGAAIVLTSTVIFLMVFVLAQLNNLRHRLFAHSSNPRKPGGRLSMPNGTSMS